MNDKLEDLEKRLEAVKKANAAKKRDDTVDEAEQQRMNRGLQAGIELVTSIIAGGLLGYFLDDWLGTGPLFLIIFLLGGMAAGFLGVYKITNDMGSSMGFTPLHKDEKKGKKARDEQMDPHRNKDKTE